MANKWQARFLGDAAIGRAIRGLNTRLNNLNQDVQDIAVSIIAHSAAEGNGDMSRALDLCKVVRRHKTMNVNYLVGFFAYFGRATVNLRANDGEGKVSLISKDAKRYRPVDVDGAKANNWFNAMNADGTRAKWYEGPAPAAYVPDTIGDLADQLDGFVERMNKRLDGTKTVNGKEVPLVRISAEDEAQFHNALQFISRIAATLKRHEDVQELTAKLAEVTAEAGQDDEVLAVIEPKEKAVA